MKISSAVSSLFALAMLCSCGEKPSKVESPIDDSTGVATLAACDLTNPINISFSDHPKLFLDPQRPYALRVSSDMVASCTCELRIANGGGVNLKVYSGVAGTMLRIQGYQTNSDSVNSQTFNAPIDPGQKIMGFVHTDDRYYFIGVDDARDFGGTERASGNMVNLTDAPDPGVDLTYAGNTYTFTMISDPGSVWHSSQDYGWVSSEAETKDLFYKGVFEQ